MSNLSPSATAVRCVSAALAAPTLEALPGRLTDLGGLEIRRLLPRSRRRLVGPWCFLDSYGPLSFSSGKPMDVAPHPHIGLQTVSWLVEGEVLHRDSLGLEGTARPGVLNLMTAGRGIAHSEETPRENRERLHGVQLWIALPEASRDVAPSFEQHLELPVLELERGRATLVMGELSGLRSKATFFSPLVAAEISAEANAKIVLPLSYDFEHALVPLRGACRLDGEALAIDTLYYLGCGRRNLTLVTDREPLRALLIGGEPFGETILMWWNFVARTTDEIASAREDWELGRRFGEVNGYDGERVFAPPFIPRPSSGSE